MSSDPRRQPVIINNKALDYVDKFTYLGSILSLHGGSEEDITSHMGKARSAFFRLRSVWKSNKYSRETTLRLYQSIVLSALLYGSEFWRLTERDSSRLAAFHSRLVSEESWECSARTKFPIQDSIKWLSKNQWAPSWSKDDGDGWVTPCGWMPVRVHEWYWPGLPREQEGGEDHVPLGWGLSQRNWRKLP